MNRRITWLWVSFFVQCIFYANAQPVTYSWKIINTSNKLSKTAYYPINIGIYSDSETMYPVFIEKQYLQLKGDSVIDLMMGKGKGIYGNIDSVIWSEGRYYLSISSDSIFNNMELLTHKVLMRIPSFIKADNVEGIVEEKILNGTGEIVIPFSKTKRPKKISVDLTTSYVNLAYPADTYPIYRHYEWFDEDADGRGNSLTLSYSENAKHAFVENTNRLGEIKLYTKPFQELEIHTSSKSVNILISKPIPIENHTQTFAIKGPWKLIYLLEW